LSIDEEVTKQKVRKNLKSDENPVQIKEENVDKIVENAHKEYYRQIEGVKDSCKGYIHELDANKTES